MIFETFSHRDKIANRLDAQFSPIPFIVLPMALDPAHLPDDIVSLKAMLIAADKRAFDAEARAKDLDAEIENLKLAIAKMQHDKFGASSERSSRLLDQLELRLGELVEQVAQNAAADAIAALAATPSQPDEPERRQHRRPARRPLPEHLPRERVMYPAPSICPCCSGTAFRKLGADE